MNWPETAAGEKLFAGDAVQTLLKKGEKGNFAVGAWSEIRGAAFRRRGTVATAVPIENGFSQAGAGGDYRDIFFRVIDSAVEIEQVFLFEFLQAAGGCHQVVHQDHSLAR